MKVRGEGGEGRERGGNAKKEPQCPVPVGRKASRRKWMVVKFQGA